MAEKSIMDKMQTAFGITRAELLAVIVLVGGLLTGVLIKFVVAGNTPVYYTNSSEITYLLDSLAEAEIVTYTGANDTTLSATSSKISIDSSRMKFSEANKPAEKLDLNSATKNDLMRLPGVGPKTADDIIVYRKEKPFSKPSDLMEIKGIGIKKFEKMKSFIIVK